MIHLLMLIASLGLALVLRLFWRWQYPRVGNWSGRWYRSLIAFVLPPLLLLSTAIALLWMGPICRMAQHQMIHGWQGTLTYSWAAVYLAMVLLAGLWLGLDGYQAVGQLSRYEQLNLDIAPATSPDQTLSGKTITSTTPARLLPTGFPYIAQIGLWRPQLVLSQGLLDQLDHLHLDAVLCHEAAHLHYSDTAWFAGLGLLRRCSGWLPNTDALWQELLLLRELRADRWAAQRVDPLLLAEALFTVVSTPLYPDSRIDFSAAFNEQLVSDRLNERVDALLQATPPDTAQNFQTWRSLLLLIVATAVVGLPLWTLALHY